MAGWGMGPEPFVSLAGKGCDLFICYDYRTLTWPDMDLFSSYERLDLLAWSMGVWVAAYLFAGRESCFTQAMALGGTLQPIDDRKGIPVTAFEETIRTLDEERLLAFYFSMFDDQAQVEAFMNNRPRRPVSSVRDELINLKSKVQQAGAVQDIFNRKIVTLRDRIFPGRNQLRAWGKQTCEQKKWSHFPFYGEEFLQAILPISDERGAR